MRLRREECIEDLVRLLRGQSNAGITDTNHELFSVRSMRLDGKLAHTVHILHCLNAVQDEVHHDLLQLHPISHHPRKVCSQLCSDCNRAARHLAAEENDHLLNQFIDIDQLLLSSATLEVQ